MPHGEPTRGVSLPPLAFAAAFPYHIAIGRDLRVRQVGLTVARLLPDAAAGAFLPDHFRLVHPVVPFDFDSLCRPSTSVVCLESTSTPLSLEGQMWPSPEQDCVIFLCAPAGTSAVAESGSPVIPDTATRPVAVTERAQAPAAREARPLRILLVHGTTEPAVVARPEFQALGAQVDLASDGPSAIDLAARTRYDLVLLQLPASSSDGARVARAIRDAERIVDDEPVPIVAIAADAAEGLREQSLAAGMNEYLDTPLDTLDLTDLVRRWADRRPAVLIADDSPEIRQLVRHRLRDTYRIVQAVNGLEALEQFGRQHISVVLLDMNMPVMDGYATATALRRRDDGKVVPIVAVTGNEESESRERAAAAGCSMHLMKPVRLATLFSTVEAAMRQAASVADGPSTGPPVFERNDQLVQLDIDPLLADLVPGYVRDKRRQLGELRRYIAEHDMDRVKRIAHDIKGTGSAYGIPDVTRLGRALETAGQQCDEGQAAVLVEELDTLLARVQQQLGG